MSCPRFLRLAVLASVLLVTRTGAAPAGRIVAIGDVHGAADAFASILARAGLIDAQRRWTGGAVVFVQTGDLLARGAGVRTVLDLLIALEPQASAAGGRVVALLGNHEMMTMMGETRDTNPDVFRAFTDERSESRREQAFQAASRISKANTLDKAAWFAAHPQGFIEYREAFAPNGPYGRWLRSKPILAEIDGSVFLHGGVNPAFTTESLDNISRRARRELNEWDEGARWLEQHRLALPFFTLQEVLEAAQAERARLSVERKMDSLSEDDLNAARALLPILNIGSSSLLSPEGPLWFRGYSTWTDAQGAPLMAGLLKKYHVKRFVTGHTPQVTGRITPRFSNTLFLIDTGMLGGKFYPTGRPSALEIKGDTVTPIYIE